MIGEINKSLKSKTPTVWLCKPDRTRIAPLKEAKDKINITYRYNDIHEISIEILLASWRQII